jgi:MFS family permease
MQHQMQSFQRLPFGLSLQRYVYYIVPLWSLSGTAWMAPLIGFGVVIDPVSQIFFGGPAETPDTGAVLYALVLGNTVNTLQALVCGSFMDHIGVRKYYAIGVVLGVVGLALSAVSQLTQQLWLFFVGWTGVFGVACGFVLLPIARGSILWWRAIGRPGLGTGVYEALAGIWPAAISFLWPALMKALGTPVSFFVVLAIVVGCSLPAAYLVCMPTEYSARPSPGVADGHAATEEGPATPARLTRSAHSHSSFGSVRSLLSRSGSSIRSSARDFAEASFSMSWASDFAPLATNTLPEVISEVSEPVSAVRRTASRGKLPARAILTSGRFWAEWAMVLVIFAPGFGAKFSVNFVLFLAYGSSSSTQDTAQFIFLLVYAIFRLITGAVMDCWPQLEATWMMTFVAMVQTPILIGTGLFLMYGPADLTASWVYVILNSIIGLTLAVARVALPMLALRSWGSANFGTALGALLSAQGLAGTLGPLTCFLALTSGIPPTPTEPEGADGPMGAETEARRRHQVTIYMWIAAAVSACGGILSVYVGRAARREQSADPSAARARPVPSRGQSRCNVLATATSPR